MATNKRIRGIAIHRSILIGSTATPLSEVDRISSPPDHTHRWTVAVRSAASHPLPTIADSEASTSSASNASRDVTATPAPGGQTTPAPTSGVSTRGREHETDYHKMVGGKDDISHFIKRVQFKLHETYPQSTRSIDKAPFQVTETGWGEFDIQIKIIFVAESGEKPLTTYHRLKLHPWHPVSMRAAEIETVTQEAAAASSSVVGDGMQEEQTIDAEESAAPEETLDISMDVDEKGSSEQLNLSAGILPQQSQVIEANTSNSGASFPPVVHSWSYDEIVFPEPTEAFYEILVANPPTPLPAQSAQAFADSSAYNKYRDALDQLNDTSGPKGRDLNRDSGIKPPHPLHNSSGALFDALSQESIQSEAERFDKARYNAVYQLEDTRQQLIEGERKLREGRIGQSRPITSS